MSYSSIMYIFLSFFFFSYHQVLQLLLLLLRINSRFLTARRFLSFGLLVYVDESFWLSQLPHIKPYTLQSTSSQNDSGMAESQGKK